MIGLVGTLVEHFPFISGRCVERGIGNPLALTARELLDLTYFLCIEGQDKKEIEKIDRALEGPLRLQGPKTQEDRLAAIRAMGGGVV